jgi:hypothetical protein
MAVNGQFQPLSTVPWGKSTLYPQCMGLDGPHGRLEILRKSQMFYNFQNLNPDLSARRISFMIIVITDFGLTGLDLKALEINNESYVIYEAKGLVLNFQKT